MSKEVIRELAKFGGIIIGSDVFVHDDRLYDRLLSDGSLGLGESYMEGWWSSGNMTLDQLSYRVNSTDLHQKLREASFLLRLKMGWAWLSNLLSPIETVAQSKVVAEKHYDLGNEVYDAMLGRPTIYSCGYFRDTTALPVAQINKMELISKKILAVPGIKRILEIGCGWGDLAVYLAKSSSNFQVDAITISKEQYNYCLEHRQHPQVQFHLVDYRDFYPDHKYDAIVSVGMFEHVNQNNYREFMEICSELLNPGGVMLLHTIGKNISETHSDPWITTYIFPNSCLPSLTQITEAVEGLFVVEDLHNFGPDYDKTLMAWNRNFQEKFHQINEIRADLGKSLLDERFRRMWEYYLLVCAGLFRARKTQLYQVMLSKGLSSYRRPFY